MWFGSDYIKEHTVETLFGIFIACLISNATVLLPSSSLVIVVQAANILNPILVGLFAALGCSIGEMMSFFFGQVSENYLDHTKTIKKLVGFIKPNFNKYPYIVVFIFSAIPIPIFDVVGILSGIYKLNPIKYFFSVFIGKLIKCLFFSVLANMAGNFFV